MAQFVRDNLETRLGSSTISVREALAERDMAPDRYLQTLLTPDSMGGEGEGDEQASKGRVILNSSAPAPSGFRFRTTFSKKSTLHLCDSETWLGSPPTSKLS